jgi:hypothetical protein
MKKVIEEAQNIFEYWCAPIEAQILIKNRFIFQIILFQKILEFKHTIALYCGKQQSLAL